MVSRRRYILGSLLAIAAIALITCAPALASSAGDQQYIDPLTGSTANGSQPPSASGSSGSAAPSSSSSAASAPTTSAGAQSTTTASSATQASAAGRQSSAGTLPRTGLNIVFDLVLGVGLASAGLALRRGVRRGC